MKKTIFSLSTLAIVILLTAASCTNETPTPTPIGNQTPTTNGANQNNNATNPATRNPDNVKLVNSNTLGQYLTDDRDMALYLYTKDTKNDSVCTGQCLVNWPIFYKENLTVPTGLNPADFGEIKHSTGVMQSTYMGWPLYYYIGDKKAGDTNGENVGKVWYLIKPDYNVLFSTGINGDYLVDSRGMTLYYFNKDSRDKSTCTDQCLANWPILEADTLKVPSLLNKADFASTKSADGKDMVTFKGWPLYYYINDNAKGDTKGQNVNAAWFTVNPQTMTEAK